MGRGDKLFFSFILFIYLFSFFFYVIDHYFTLRFEWPLLGCAKARSHGCAELPGRLLEIKWANNQIRMSHVKI